MSVWAQQVLRRNPSSNQKALWCRCDTGHQGPKWTSTALSSTCTCLTCIFLHGLTSVPSLSHALSPACVLTWAHFFTLTPAHAISVAPSLLHALAPACGPSLTWAPLFTLTPECTTSVEGALTSACVLAAPAACGSPGTVSRSTPAPCSPWPSSVDCSQCALPSSPTPP